MLVHLDTDFGGDPDDACALGLLLAWPEVEVIGVTTTLEHDGKRAGCVQYVLGLARRSDIPVVAGAEATLTGNRFECTWGDDRYWPESFAALPTLPGAATDALTTAIDAGATIIAIGGLTNLAELELAQPGVLAGASIVAMGGWVDPLAAGLPPWGPERDFNIQCDTRAAEVVAASGADLTLALLPITAEVHLRGRDLPRLRTAGVLGRLFARQAEVYALDKDRAALVAGHEALPADLLNFHWDPVTAAVAVGWPGTTVEEAHLRTEFQGDALAFVRDQSGPAIRILTAVDADAFAETWLQAVDRLP
ncbi:MAG: nucleoside hydrolase [Acidimicrobiales bacterium]